MLPPSRYACLDFQGFVITYRTDPEALAAVVPEPLEVGEPLAKYDFIRMPDSTSFGDYTETGQVIRSAQWRGGCLRSFDVIWTTTPDRRRAGIVGVSEKTGDAENRDRDDVLVGTLHYGSVLYFRTD